MKVKHSILFLCIVIPILLLGISFLYLMGCAFSSHSFECRVIAPSVMFGAWVSISCLLVLLLSIRGSKEEQGITKWKSFLQIVLISIIFLSALVPIALNVIKNFVPEPRKLELLDGYTLEACKNGKPAVLWGENPYPNYYSDNCYFKLGVCDKILDEGIRQSCYFGPDGKIKEGLINSFDECKKVGDYYRVLACERGMAAKTNNWKYCESVADEKEEVSIGRRNQCFTEVAEYDPNNVGKEMESQMYAIQNRNDPTACNAFDGLRRDVCAFWMMEYSGDSWCSLIKTSEIYKKDCFRYYQLVNVNNAKERSNNIYYKVINNVRPK